MIEYVPNKNHQRVTWASILHYQTGNPGQLRKVILFSVKLLMSRLSHRLTPALCDPRALIDFGFHDLACKIERKQMIVSD